MGGAMQLWSNSLLKASPRWACDSSPRWYLYLYFDSSPRWAWAWVFISGYKVMLYPLIKKYYISTVHHGGIEFLLADIIVATSPRWVQGQIFIEEDTKHDLHRNDALKDEVKQTQKTHSRAEGPIRKTILKKWILWEKNSQNENLIKKI